MKDIKIKESGGAPRVLDSAARAPKELMRRNLISTKKQAEQTAASEQYDESPVEYAGNRVERATEDTAHHAGEQAKQTVKKTVQKANDTRRLRKETRQYADGGTEYPRSSFSSESSATRQGRERASQNYQRTRRAQQTSRQTAQHGIRTTKTTAETTQQTAKAAKGTVKTAQQTAKAAKGTVKTAQRTVKTAKATVKTAQKSVKTVQTAAKATQRTAQAAAKAAQTAAKAAQAAAKAAAAAAKVAAKAIAAVIKAIIAAVKAIIAAIAAGGWVAVVVIIVVVLIVALLAVFGVFSANESADGSKPMTEAIETINAEFQTSVNGRIAELSGDSGADIVEIIYEGDMESLDSPAPNWADVIGVYSAKTSFDPENPADVTVVNDENIERLRTVFYDMNSVSYRTETETDTRTVTDEYGAIVLDENGDPVIETTTTLYIYVNVVSIDYRDGAEHYSFNADQNEVLAELMRPEYYPLFAELIGDTVGDGGEYGLGLDINPDLSPNELGTQLVEAAKKYIGRSYSSMDCSKLVRTAYNDCGLSSMNGLTSTGMAQKCNEMGVLFTDASELQAGDLIFFARKDASRGEGYCTDTRRCGTGKCKRWQQIHHVAIYINGEFLIDSTGGNNSVQIRKHWGKNGSEWEWVCFGRPAN